jgi:hypothetical protein
LTHHRHRHFTLPFNQLQHHLNKLWKPQRAIILLKLLKKAIKDQHDSQFIFPDQQAGLKTRKRVGESFYDGGIYDGTHFMAGN